mmetsp:Transcript_6294/g.8239  ORF Transcript_6294/g.8239 Transcript_6294/m.8239 type:complete len:96 (+) Transcript_6294:467-754(+)
MLRIIYAELVVILECEETIVHFDTFDSIQSGSQPRLKPKELRVASLSLCCNIVDQFHDIFMNTPVLRGMFHTDGNSLFEGNPFFQTPVLESKNFT